MASSEQKKKSRRSSEKSSGGTAGVDLLNIILLAALVLLFFGDILLRQQVLFAGDIMNVYSPWQFYNQQAISAGRLPLWSDDLFSGFPLFAESQGALFYPPTRLIYAFAAPLDAFTWDVLLHFILAAWFQYFFARSLNLGPAPSFLASVVFAFSGMFMSLPVNFTIFRSIVWIPLIFTFLTLGSRRHSLFYPLMTALCLVMQMMGGSLQVTAITGLAMVPYTFFLMVSPGSNRKGSAVIPILQFILSVILAAGLYAFQLTPTLELLKYAWRAAMGGYDVAVEFSFHPSHFIEVLLPTFYGSYADRSYLPVLPVTANFFPYIGVVPILLILGSAWMSTKRGVFIMYFLLALALVLALGKYGPLYKTLYDYVPYFDIFRAPDRFWIIAVVAGSMLAGFGLDRMVSWVESGKRKDAPLASGTFAVLFLLLTLFFAGAMYLPALQRIWGSAISPVVAMLGSYFNLSKIAEDPGILARWKTHLVFAFAHMCGTVMLFNYAVALFGKKDRGQLLAGMIILIAIVDLFFMSFNVPALRTTSRSFFRDPPRSARVLRETIKNDAGIAELGSERFWTYGREFFAKRIFSGRPGADATLWYNGGGSNNINDYLKFREELSPNIHMHWGLTSANGFASLFLERYFTLERATDRQLLRLIKGVKPENLVRDSVPGADLSPSEWADRTFLLDLLSVRYLVSAVELETAGRFRLIDDGPMRIYENKMAYPRAWICMPEQVFGETGSSLGALASGQLDPERTLILNPLPSSPRIFTNSDPGRGRAQISLPGAQGPAASGGAIHDEQVLIEVSSPQPAYLVLADTYYPGWFAEIDGQPVNTIYRAFGYFRAIEIPPGEHLVRFEYNPLSFKLGVSLSIATLITLLIIVLIQALYFNRKFAAREEDD